MRLAAAAKLGFYPASPVAVEGILKHLKMTENVIKRSDVYILDPCCGEGAAIHQIAQGLSVDEDNIRCVELDAGRAARARERMPQAVIEGPATYLGCHISPGSFGLAYVNPPFDHELGGGRREEDAFVFNAMKQLAPRGILVLVCPLNTLKGRRSLVEMIDANFEDMRVYKFPDGDDPETGQPVRPFNEIVMIGRKRKATLPSTALNQHGDLHKMEWHYGYYIQIQSLPQLGEIYPKSYYNGRASYDREEEVRVWEVPPGWRPTVFRKIAFTDEELGEVLEASPLHRLLKEVAAFSRRSARPCRSTGGTSA